MIYFLRSRLPTRRICSSFDRSISTSVLNITDTACLVLEGRDTHQFLQGLITNDVMLLKENNEECVHAAFLNPKGRVITDMFLYSLKNNDDESQIIIECPTKMIANLKRSMMMYKLKSAVKIQDCKGLSSILVTPFINDDNLQQNEIDKEDIKNNLKLNNKNIITANWDPRCDNFGIRMLYEDNDSDNNINTDTVNSSSSKYKRYRILKGIAEGIELYDQIPLECNLDLLNGISFKKGCYVGQELISRTKHRGIVRKRIVPFVIGDDINNNTNFNYLPSSSSNSFLLEDDIETNLDIKRGDILKMNDSDDNIGEVISCDGNVGLILMRLNYLLESDNVFHINQSTILPFKPLWWPTNDPLTEKKLIM